MALSDEQIEDIATDYFADQCGVARAMKMIEQVEAEVRKDDEPLIRQMRNALALPCDRWNATQSRIVREAIDAADARLEGKK